MARQDDHVRHTVRIPRDIYTRISNLPGEGSINAKIVNTLASGSAPASLTAAHLAEALHCFWNAAIGAAHDRQSTTAMEVASVMAEGIGAVAARLSEIEAAPQTLDALIAHNALVAAERFIVGFEDDEAQEGIPELLATVRAAIGGAA